MERLLVVLILFFIGEYIGDFLLQSRHTATTKTSNALTLLWHVVVIFISIITVCAIPVYFMYPEYVFLGVVQSVALCTMLHYIQDCFIWKCYKLVLSRRIKKRAGCFSGHDVSRCAVNASIAIYVRDRKYAEDKAFYDFIGLDRLLHTLVIIASLFYYIGV